MVRALYYGQPIARADPLNRGLVERWRCVPWYMSGPRLIGLCGKYHGTLTNGAKFAGALGQPGGDGAVSFDGTDDYVSVPSALIGALPAGKVSVLTWIRPTGSLTAYQAVFDGTTNGSSGGRQLSAFLGGAANHLFVSFAGANAAGELTLTDSWVANVWQQLGLTWDGTTVRVYRNGVEVGNAASGSSGAFTACEWRIGGNPSGGGAAFQGQQDDTLVFGRTLAAADIRAWCEQSGRGDPQSLSWLTRRSRFAAASAPVDQPHPLQFNPMVFWGDHYDTG